MSARGLLLGVSLSLLCTAEVARTQDEEKAAGRGGTSASTPAPVAAVTATAGAERVRFIAPADVVRIRVELFSESGQSVVDVTSKGNVFDWNLQDGGGQAVADGAYLAVVTVKSLGGKLAQRVGTVSVQGTAVSLSPAQSAGLTSAQQEAVGPLEWNAALTFLPEGDAPAATIVGHDGKDGQVTSTTGALTFRTGDVFAGSEKEAMRITPEGQVGIGTDTPQATLDVAGTLRARGGIKFDDGSVVTSTGRLGRVNADGTMVAPVAGTGTPNQVTKWIDGAGTLANSAITEIGGAVGINTTSPGATLHLFNTATQDVFAGMGPDINAGPAMNYGYAGSTFGRGAGFFNVRPDASALAPNPSLRFMTNNLERVIIRNTGTVGIGTNPYTNVDGDHMLTVVASGLGRAGQFVVNNTSNVRSAVRAESNGTGSTVSSVNTGQGRAGLFTIANPASDDNAIEATTNGTGKAALYSISNAASAGIVFEATTNGTGRAGLFTITNAGSSANALQASTAGTGFAGVFNGGQGVSVVGNVIATGSLVVNGSVSLGALAGATATHVCINGTTLALCSSSGRYKTDVTSYRAGLDVVTKLRPVNFQWKGRDERDLGFIAEEVNQIEPLLSLYNKEGVIEGVKYDQLSVVFVNAIKEQQQQIEELRAELANLKHGPARK